MQERANFCSACGKSAGQVAPQGVGVRATPNDAVWAAAIGPNGLHYYLPKFQAFERAGASMSWSWPAFFLTFWWCLYRKMWLWALLYWLSFVVLGIGDGILVAVSGEEDAFPVFTVLGFMAALTIVPMYADALYFHHLRGKIHSIERSVADPELRIPLIASAGGTSGIIVLVIVIMVGIAVLGILAAVAIPSYQDYTARAQITEGIGLTSQYKQSLADYYSDNGSFSGLGTNDLHGARSGKYVADVTIAFAHENYLAIAATFKGNGGVSAQIAGKEFRIATDDGGQNWTCGSAIPYPELMGENHVEAKLMPSSCK